MVFLAELHRGLSMPQYTHTLIATSVDFAPDPKQVSGFLGTLISMGAAPLDPAISVSKLSGEVRSIKNPFSREAHSYRARTTKEVKDLAGASNALAGIDDYNIALAGKGPPGMPALVLDFQGKYDFAILCCLRAEIVSTSDWHDEIAVKRRVEFFGRPCSPKSRRGIFHNPHTRKTIEVRKAGCARFWIEFEYGNMLFPAIESSLELLAPAIVQAARKEFGVGFVQGCHWCA